MNTTDATTREVIAGLEAEIARHEEQTAVLGRVLFDTQVEITFHENRAATLTRLVEQLRRMTGDGGWDTVQVDELVDGDVYRFEVSGPVHTVASCGWSQGGVRFLVWDEETVRHLDPSTAVQVRFPRPPAAGAPAEVHHLPGIGVVHLGAQSSVAELHEAIAGHVGDAEPVGVGR